MAVPLVVRLHWFGASFSVENLDSVKGLMSEVFGEADEARGSYTYKNRLSYGGGCASVMFSAVESVGAYGAERVGEVSFLRPDAFVEITGGGLDGLSPEQLAGFLRRGSALGVKCTRLDAAVDVPGEVVSVEQIEREIVGPKLHGPFRSVTVMREHAEGGGHSIYFGKRGKEGCGAQFVVYDKGVRIGSPDPLVRFEVRLFKERAEAGLSHVVGGVDPWSCEGFDLTVDALAGRLGELVAGAVDFYATDSRGARVVAPWWETIRGSLRRGEDKGAG